MKHQEIVKRIEDQLPYPAEEVEEILNAYYDAVMEAIAAGNDVELGGLGKAVTRMRDGLTADGSPRTPKRPHYAVVFKISASMKKRLQDPV